MNEEAVKKHGEKVVKHVMKHWRRCDSISKRHFEEGLNIIITQIAKTTKIPVEDIGQHTHQVIEEFASEYKNVPENIQGYEVIISMLYVKYMQKVGVL